MLLNEDGSFIRDIDIDELRISFSHHNWKTIVLTKEKITYLNNMNFPQDDVYSKEIAITPEQFKNISDRIHEAGLYNLLQPMSEHNIFAGAVYQTLSCIFDDGAQYEYITQETPAKEFDAIGQILLSLCDCSQTTNKGI